MTLIAREDKEVTKEPSNLQFESPLTDQTKQQKITTKKEPCDSITCYNGGTCKNDFVFIGVGVSCQCLPGFTGERCEKGIKPSYNTFDL